MMIDCHVKQNMISCFLVNNTSGVVVALSRNGWMNETTLLRETELWMATACLGCLQIHVYILCHIMWTSKQTLT